MMTVVCEHLTVREEAYQEFLLKYAAIEDKQREVIVKIVEAQKTLVVCISLSIHDAYMTVLALLFTSDCFPGTVCQKTSGDNRAHAEPRREPSRGSQRDQTDMSRYAVILWEAGIGLYPRFVVADFEGMMDAFMKI